MTLIVLGSANRDYTVVVERHPQPGETLLGGSIATGTGGKGANQAAAAARAGARPVFVAAVGDDSSGTDILSDLEGAGVDVSNVARSTEPTGVALITVSRAGENTIVVAAGANATLHPEPTAALIGSLTSEGSVLLSQLEIPLPVLFSAATTATAGGARFLLNLSPYQPVSAELLELADPLILNESEAAELAGLAVESQVDAETVARALLTGSRSVVITLGGDGVVLADSLGVTHLPTREVPVVDTTGAGDAFAGALAASLARGGGLADAVASGIHAGSIAVQHLGAQPPQGFVGV